MAPSSKTATPVRDIFTSFLYRGNRNRCAGHLLSICWYILIGEAVNVFMDSGVCLPWSMYECNVSVTALSCNSRFISEQRTREVIRDESQQMDPLTMMRPVVIGSLQPWHSSPNLAQ